MPVSRRTPQRPRRVVAARLVSTGIVLALTACTSGSSEQPPAPEPAFVATPLADYDTSDLTLVRGDFCDRVAAGAVSAAVGVEESAIPEVSAWQPGRRLPGTRDLGNEFGCSWTDSATTATAWVFAPPISRTRAADFATAPSGRGCESLDAPTQLRSALAQRCTVEGGTTTRIAGLVGDAWMGCEINGTDDTDRVGEWCVAALTAMHAP